MAEGLRRFGESQWVAIKQAYPRELARLDNVSGSLLLAMGEA